MKTPNRDNWRQELDRWEATPLIKDDEAMAEELTRVFRQYFLKRVKDFIDQLLKEREEEAHGKGYVAGYDARIDDEERVRILTKPEA